ncbi:MAG: AAA family ATPase [Desulfurococcaceae archaeon]
MEIRITEYVLMDRSLLIGPPGIGKTERVRQLAEEEARRLGRTFVDLKDADAALLDRVEASPERFFAYTRIAAPHVFPEDLSYPRPRDGYVEAIPPRAFKVLSLRGIAGVLFVDELGNVQRDDQMAMYFTLMQEKEAAWVKLREEVFVVAAANPPEWSPLAREVPAPLRNRLAVFRVLPPRVEEWVAYMDRTYGDAWDRRVAAYLAVFREDLLRPPREGELENFPTPRSWTRLALELPRTPPHLHGALCSALVGREVGSRFHALLSARVDVRALLEGLERDPKSFGRLSASERALVVAALAQSSDEELLKRVGLLKLMAEEHREFLAALLSAIPRRRRVALFSRPPLSEVAERLAKEVGGYLA